MALFNSLDERNFIIQIQRILRDLSYLSTQNGMVGIDGIYDDATKNAVKDFQRKYGLDATSTLLTSALVLFPLAAGIRIIVVRFESLHAI